MTCLCVHVCKCVQAQLMFTQDKGRWWPKTWSILFFCNLLHQLKVLGQCEVSFRARHPSKIDSEVKINFEKKTYVKFLGQN